MPERRALAAIVSFSIYLSMAVYAEAPFIDPAEDAKYFGDPDNDLFWTLEEKVAGFRNMHRLDVSRRVPAGDNPYPLPEQPMDLGNVLISTESGTRSVSEHIRMHNIAGLIVVKNGNIVYERYELGNTRSTRWISYSVAKSITSLLIGAALKDGYIQSVDEPVSDYLPRLNGSAYDQCSLRNLLQMSSGVEWNEDYSDPESDINTIPWDTLSVYEYLREKPRSAPPGEKFNYNTAETNLVGTLLRSAIGNNLSTYLSEKIWQPFGMESDAYWMLTEPGGGEYGGSSLVATLRDHARVGLFVIRDGTLRNGEQVLPKNWITESASPASSYNGYGYLWWISESTAISAKGIFGQGIYINRAENIVIAVNSARAQASKASDWADQDALLAALENALRE